MQPPQRLEFNGVSAGNGLSARLIPFQVRPGVQRMEFSSGPCLLYVYAMLYPFLIYAGGDGRRQKKELGEGLQFLIRWPAVPVLAAGQMSGQMPTRWNGWQQVRTGPPAQTAANIPLFSALT